MLVKKPSETRKSSHSHSDLGYNNQNSQRGYAKVFLRRVRFHTGGTKMPLRAACDLVPSS
jgi:hypothetical protein